MTARNSVRRMEVRRYHGVRIYSAAPLTFEDPSFCVMVVFTIDLGMPGMILSYDQNVQTAVYSFRSSDAPDVRKVGCVEVLSG